MGEESRTKIIREFPELKGLHFTNHNNYSDKVNTFCSNSLISGLHALMMNAPVIFLGG